MYNNDSSSSIFFFFCLLFVVQQTTTRWTHLSKMHGLPHSAVLQQRLPTSALENRRPQTRMQTILRKKTEEQKGSSSSQEIKNPKIAQNKFIVLLLSFVLYRGTFWFIVKFFSYCTNHTPHHPFHSHIYDQKYETSPCFLRGNRCTTL